MRARAGYTLIELVSAFGTVAVLAGLGVTLIQSLMRVERSGHALLVESATASRLAQQFRNDVRLARTVEPNEKNATPVDKIVLQLSENERVEYQTRGHTMVRSVRHDDREVRSEAFRLSSRATFHFEVAEEARKLFVKLLVAYQSGEKGEGAAREVRVDAELGRSRRFREAGE